MTKQTHNLLPKIYEVDTTMTPSHQEYIYETHPEVLFALLSEDGIGLISKKRFENGQQERLALLKSYVPEFNPVVELARLDRRGIERDDIIDSVACLLTAYRIFTGVNSVLPDGDIQRDERGLRMAVVA